ncbi:histone-lysine N-methyltransferase SETMAR [Trichonephila inaurata madagascariensis]|uniref:Histone-lysine N-methyltransferase SETMAR n=1 Tax=Trichonephila inaurata madagascariensis TaxID=2747483 RepID=A0A8X7CLF1_9ARAC|nr:histone-lysine N-methyltransferase SETMAR [Trichonephila inaurata madagascariensis]
MDVSKELVRGGLLCDFKVGLSSAASSRRIRQAFGDSAVIERTARHWFQKFRSGNLSLCDKLEQDDHRPWMTDEALQVANKKDTSQTCDELSRQFNTYSETVRLNLHRIELLPTGQTVTADLYSQQLERVQQTLHQKEPALVNRKGVLCLHNNARPHVGRVARNTIQRLVWETLCHLPYSPDLSPSNYHLFRSLENHIRGKSFTNEAEVRQALTDFFASHTPEFYSKGIEQLETRWQKVLDADGDYFED